MRVTISGASKLERSGSGSRASVRRRPGVVVAHRRQVIRVVLARDLDVRPLAPEIEASRRFDDVDDERAADARRGLEEVPPAIVVRTDELGVRDAAHQAEGGDDLAVEGGERAGLRRVARAAFAW